MLEGRSNSNFVHQMPPAGGGDTFRECLSAWLYKQVNRLITYKQQGMMGTSRPLPPPLPGMNTFWAEDLRPVNRRTEMLKTLPSHHTLYVRGNKEKQIHWLDIDLYPSQLPAVTIPMRQNLIYSNHSHDSITFLKQHLCVWERVGTDLNLASDQRRSSV